MSLNNGSFTLTFIRSPFKWYSKTSIVPSPPSARGSFIISELGNTSRIPSSTALQNCVPVKDPLNLSGARTDFHYYI